MTRGAPCRRKHARRRANAERRMGAIGSGSAIGQDQAGHAPIVNLTEEVQREVEVAWLDPLHAPCPPRPPPSRCARSVRHRAASSARTASSRSTATNSLMAGLPSMARTTNAPPASACSSTRLRHVERHLRGELLHAHAADREAERPHQARRVGGHGDRHGPDRLRRCRPPGPRCPVTPTPISAPARVADARRPSRAPPARSPRRAPR